MHHGFTPREIDAMPARDVERFLAAYPTVLELLQTGAAPPPQ